MEAVLIAGGKAERLGEAAEGRPKPLVPIAGRPLAAYQVGQLAAVGVTRVIVSCAAGQEDVFDAELSGSGPEIVTVPETEPMGRGGGLRLAAQARQETGPLYVLNGDELIDVDLSALLARHEGHGAAATIVVAPLPTAFGVVDIEDDDRVAGFQDSPELPFWAHAGVNVFDDEALARLPEKGDHESTTLPALAAEGRLYAYRHAGLWLTVNTPKDLRVADDHLRANPDWLTEAARNMTEHLTSPNFGELSEFATDPTKVDKPWGYELIWALTDDYCGKILFVEAGHSLSLQFHRVKDEAWLIHSGRAKIEMGNPGDKIPNTEVVGPGAAFRMRPGTVHRVTAIEDTTIIEVSTPHLEDVVRLEDNYGRIEP